MSSFSSTPTFSLFQRGLEPRVVKRFHGLNAYSPLTVLGPDWAQDILNVIVNGNGQLSKFRLPQLISAIPLAGAPGLDQAFSVSEAIAANSLSYGPFNPRLPNEAVFTSTSANAIASINPNGAAVGVSGYLWLSLLNGTTNFTANFSAGQNAAIVAASIFTNGAVGTIQTATSATLTVGFAVTVPPNHSIVVSLAIFTIQTSSGGPGTFSVTDDKGNVYAQLGLQSVSTGVNSAQAGLWLCQGPLGNPRIITITQLTGGVIFAEQISIAEVTNLAAAGVGTGPQTIFDFQQANGVRQVFTNMGTSLAYFTNDGAIGPITVSSANPINTGPWSFVEAANILIGVNGQRAVKWTGTDLLNVGIQQATVAPTVVIVAGGLSPAFGLEWAYSYKCSGAAPGLAGPSPVEVGTASPATAQTDGGGVNHSYQLTATAPAPADPQFDTLVWWRTIDGGGDLFRLTEVNINTGVVSFNAATVTALGAIPYLSITDNTPDSKLDQTTRAPFLNAPPLIGKFAAVGQGRVVIMNLVGAPQDAIYSGFERIVIGNPPECFPPNNRLRLSIGAESIAGGGVLQAGVVMFSNTDKMYMLRGQMEDITDTAPVQFTQYLEELPWKIGCFSHATIQATPYGLIWLAGDKTVQLFDGHSNLQDISSPVYPILRGITAGAEAACTSAYFNWLERDWFVLLVPFGGAVTPNRMIMWGLDKDTSSIDIFVCTIPAEGIGTVTSSQLQRRLLIGRTGQLFNLPVSSDTINGIADLSLIPATAGQLPAYWRSGYFGNDNPQRSEMWRWLRLITDQDPRAFETTIRLVDDDLYPVNAPNLIPQTQLKSSKQGINQRAKRCSIEINWPVQDVSANVMELQVMSIPSSDR
jgi:hypothetical protein